MNMDMNMGVFEGDGLGVKEVREVIEVAPAQVVP